MDNTKRLNIDVKSKNQYGGVTDNIVSQATSVSTFTTDNMSEEIKAQLISDNLIQANDDFTIDAKINEILLNNKKLDDNLYQVYFDIIKKYNKDFDKNQQHIVVSYSTD